MGSSLRLILSGLCLSAAGALLFSMSACNEHSVEIVDATGAVEHVEPHNLGGGQELDLLWTIDNSGSMCRSQNVLREGIDGFVDTLDDINIDFHIAVTTTHMIGTEDEDPSSLEPIAQPGYLQSTPQPAPGFEDVCFHSIYGTDHPNAGEPNYSNLDPIYDTIDVAVECTENPDEWDHLLNISDEDLRCALRTTTTCDDEDFDFDEDTDYCECPESGAEAYPNCIDCGEEDVGIRDLLPEGDDFRDIPLVLRSEDYQTEDDTLDTEALRDDFACMSLVGTRGHGFEQGLNAAVRAVSPEMTGGPNAGPDDRDQHPNAGFLREDADTGLIFVSDENDCSHDGSLNTATNCGVHQCTIEESLLRTPREDRPVDDEGNPKESALLTAEELAEQFLENLAASRDLDYNESVWELTSTVLPASVHGRFQGLDDLRERLPDDRLPVECPDSQREWTSDYFTRGNWNWVVPPSCRGPQGVAWSGHRYEEFLRQFDEFFPRPSASDPESPLDGHICRDFEPILNEIADFFGAEAAGCIDNVYRCDGPDDTCPGHPHLDQEGSCTAYPGDNSQFYCDTGIEVRLVPGDEHSRDDLEATGYCLDDTFGEPGLEDTCVINPDMYRWSSCEEEETGLLLTWENENWIQQIGDFNSVIRYTSFDAADDGNDQNNDDQESENNE